MKAFNKLVRDRIPEIIKAKGETPIIRVLGDAEFNSELNKKLEEEVREYLADESMEELADVLEVIHGLLLAKNKTFDELESVRKEKAAKRGGFCERIFLERVE